MRAEGSNAEFEGGRGRHLPTSKAGTALPVRIFRENRNWYWRFDDQRGWHSGYKRNRRTGRHHAGLGARRQPQQAAGAGEVLAATASSAQPETKLVTRFRLRRLVRQGRRSQGRAPGPRGARSSTNPPTPTAKPPGSPSPAARRRSADHGGRRQAALVAPHQPARRTAPPRHPHRRRVEAARPLRHRQWCCARHRPAKRAAPASPGPRPRPRLPALERGNRQARTWRWKRREMAPDQPLKVKIRVPDARGSRPWSRSPRSMSASSASPASRARPAGFFFAKAALRARPLRRQPALIESMAGQKGKAEVGWRRHAKPTKSLRRRCAWSTCSAAGGARCLAAEAEVSLPVARLQRQLRLMAVAASGRTSACGRPSHRRRAARRRTRRAALPLGGRLGATRARRALASPAPSRK